jgi:4-hydroxy-tetrahydrodipicolinate synthase
MKTIIPNSQPAGPSADLHRREFLQFLGVGAVGLALSARSAMAQADSSAAPAPAAAPASGSRQLRGLFPIAETPFTEDNKLDLDSLAAEVTFCNRGGVHGFMWPQNASGWSTMSEDERISGAEAILGAGKGGNTAIVIGVQGPDMATVTRYAQHAAKNGADGIISLPPANVTDETAILNYYQQLGAVTDLPLFAQCVGNMSVDLVVNMVNTIPTLRHVKDEAGVPHKRIAELRRRTNDQLKVFSGNGVLTMISELELGYSGYCPYTGLADVYSATFDLWHAGQRREAFDMFGRILAFNSLGAVDQNRLLIDRGVFPPTAHFRTPTTAGGGGGGGGAARALPLSDKGARAGLEHYLKPVLKA